MGRIGHMATVALASLAIGAEAWGAGWSTNCWPATNFPRRLDQQIAEVYTATVERCTVTGVTAPSTSDVLGWRDERADLVDLKSKVKTLIPYFVDTSRTNAAGNYTNYFEIGVSDLPFLSVTGLCARLKMPTNYLDYTPYRHLTGSNDGFTNSSTIAGGSSYPDGKTNWMTSDFGISRFPDLLNALIWTRTNGTVAGTAWWGYGIAYGSGNLSAAQTAAEGAYAPTTDPYEWWGCLNSYYWTGTRWNADIRGSSYTISGTARTSNIWETAQYYAYCTNAANNNTYAFTNFGLGWINGVYNLVGTGSETNGISLSFGFGTTNKPLPWGTSSAYQGYTFSTYASGKAPRIVLKWDGANGFQYK